MCASTLLFAHCAHVTAQHRTIMLHAVLASLLLQAAVVVAQSTNAAIVSTNVTTALPVRVSPACAYNIHSVAAIPTVYLVGGTINSSAFASDTYWASDALVSGTVTAYLTTPLTQIPNVGATLPQRTSAALVYLNNGALVHIGGLLLSGGRINTVTYSTNNGQLWSSSNNTIPWTPRSELAACAMPMSTLVVIGGGVTNDGTHAMDVWLSVDGHGQSWALQASSSAVDWTDGNCVGLYNSAAVGPLYSAANATLILLSVTGSVYHSYDLGRTTTFISTLPWAGSPRPSSIFISDRDNDLYQLGGAEIVDGTIYYSTDGGYTWLTLLSIINGVTTTVQYSSTCGALYYVQSAGGVWNKNLVAYDGNITSNSTNASPIAVRAQFQMAIGPFTPVQETGTPGLTFNTPSTLILPSRSYQACAYDVHSVLPTPLMLMIGGRPTLNATNSSALRTFESWISADAFTETAQSYTPTTLTDGTTPLPSIQSGGAAFLNNHNVLAFGGIIITSNTPQYTNAVYRSMDGAYSWSLAAASVGWSARSGFAYCAMPFSNNVVMIGGESASGLLNETWLNADGAGASWSLQSAALPAFVSGACVGLYDSSFANPSYSSPNSTIVLLHPSGHIYTSINLGSSWSTAITAPWTLSNGLRAFMNIVADRNNNLFALGSAYGFNDATAWFSGNHGLAWVSMGSTVDSTVTALSGSAAYAFTQQSCLAFRNAQLSLTSTTQTRQLVVYGGATAFGASQSLWETSVHATVTGLSYLSTEYRVTSVPSLVRYISPYQTYYKQIFTATSQYTDYAPTSASLQLLPNVTSAGLIFNLSGTGYVSGAVTSSQVPIRLSVNPQTQIAIPFNRPNTPNLTYSDLDSGVDVLVGGYIDLMITGQWTVESLTGSAITSNGFANDSNGLLNGLTSFNTSGSALTATIGELVMRIGAAPVDVFPSSDYFRIFSANNIQSISATAIRLRVPLPSSGRVYFASWTKNTLSTSSLRISDAHAELSQSNLDAGP